MNFNIIYIFKSIFNFFRRHAAEYLICRHILSYY